MQAYNRSGRYIRKIAYIGLSCMLILATGCTRDAFTEEQKQEQFEKCKEIAANWFETNMPEVKILECELVIDGDVTGYGLTDTVKGTYRLSGHQYAYLYITEEDKMYTDEDTPLAEQYLIDHYTADLGIDYEDAAAELDGWVNTTTYKNDFIDEEHLEKGEGETPLGDRLPYGLSEEELYEYLDDRYQKLSGDWLHKPELYLLVKDIDSIDIDSISPEIIKKYSGVACYIVDSDMQYRIELYCDQVQGHDAMDKYVNIVRKGPQNEEISDEGDSLKERIWNRYWDMPGGSFKQYDYDTLEPIIQEKTEEENSGEMAED